MIENLVNCLEISIKTGETFFEYDEGWIGFCVDVPKNAIMIQSFFLKEEYQRKGILKKFLNYLSKRFDEIWFFQCNYIMTYILLTTCLDNMYFVNRYTGEIYWIKFNETYDPVKCLEINNKLLLLKDLLKKDLKLFIERINTNDDYRELF